MTIAFQDEISQRKVRLEANGAFRLVKDFGENPPQQIASSPSARTQSLIIYGKIWFITLHAMA
jgi:hypothetical protein